MRNWVVKSVFFFVLILFSSNTFSQLSTPGKPFSFLSTLKSATAIPQTELESLQINSLIAKDNADGINNRFGIVQDVNIDLKAEGVKTIITGKGYIWQYSFNCSNSFSLGVTFSKFKIPEGATLFVYSPDHLQLLGAFTKLNNKANGILAIAELSTTNAIIEYFEPVNPEFYGELVIGSVAKAYKDVLSTTSGVVDVNCPAGANWQIDKHAVCRMTFKDGASWYWCSGALVNNTASDGKPYFLTANHCINTNASAATLTVDFNYETVSCNASLNYKNQSLSGSTLLTHNQSSDYSLLLLSETPTIAYLPYYAGWDASGAIAANATGIHHPEGMYKCISIDSSPITSYNGEISWDNSNTTAANTHWEVIFNTGIVLGGSSGSPLFNQKHHIVGQLHGGTEDTAYYGKFSLSWNADPIMSNRVSAYLDPNNTGTKVLDGMFVTPPIPGFYARPTDACIATPVRLIDTSTYFPTGRLWNISPATFSYINGTSDTSKFPVVEFSDYGNYKVTLTVSNKNGSQSLVKQNYISVKKNLDVLFSRVPTDSSICGKNLGSFAFVASGADSFKFSTNLPEKITVNQFNDSSAYYSMPADSGRNGSFSTWLIVNGWHGKCSSIDSLNLKVIYPANDFVENAMQLKFGTNGPFNNKCASIEKNEPHPRTMSCTSNTNWCNDVSNPKQINNTLWFKYTPLNNNIIIDSYGFDDRIAVYRAESASDIVSGNSANYSIIAANDNRSNTNTTAYLENIPVQSGQTYFLQLDGFEGAYGNAYINLSSSTLQVASDLKNGEVNITISYPSETKAHLYVYSTLGKLMYEHIEDVSSEKNQFSFKSSYFASGIYFILVNIGSETLKSKLLIIK